MSAKPPVRVEVIFAIRDARGLTGNQKSLLYTIESRGVAFGKWDTIAADAGLGRDAFYRARGQLISMGLLIEQRRWNDSTTYRVDLAALRHLAMPTGRSGNPETTPEAVPGIRQTIPESRNADSGNPEPKETLKKTNKKNNPPPTAAAESEEIPEQIRALIAIAPGFDDAPQDTATVEAALAASRSQVIAFDPFRSSPPRTPGPKEAIYSRNGHDRDGREQGFDPITGEYANRSEGRPIPRSRRRR